MSANITFKFTRYNPLRHARKAPAAEVEITTSDGTAPVWMSRTDLRNNIAAFGADPELVAALEAYQLNKPFPPKP